MLAATLLHLKQATPSGTKGSPHVQQTCTCPAVLNSIRSLCPACIAEWCEWCEEQLPPATAQAA